MSHLPPQGVGRDCISPAVVAVTRQARELRDARSYDAALACLAAAHEQPDLNGTEICELMLYRGKVLQFARRFAAADVVLAECCAMADALPAGPARARARAQAYFQRAMAADAADGVPAQLSSRPAHHFAVALPRLKAVAADTEQRAGDRADMRLNEAHTAQRRGDARSAVTALQEVLALQEQAGNRKGLGYTHRRLGQCFIECDERGRAVAHLRAAVNILRVHGSADVADAAAAELASIEQQHDKAGGPSAATPSEAATTDARAC